MSAPEPEHHCGLSAASLARPRQRVRLALAAARWPGEGRVSRTRPIACRGVSGARRLPRLPPLHQLRWPPPRRSSRRVGPVSVVFPAVLLGLATGCRTLTPLAAASWGARLGWLQVEGTWVSFLSSPPTPWILTLTAAAELVTDKLLRTPSRKRPFGFAARVVSGAITGTAVGATGGSPWAGLAAGVLGAVAGTFIGAGARARL
ncbi:MAG TPA: DUF4126 family protein, partial [Myxococcaceae bacterium]|nr:DUF4126 family protein [Myxococcaceae bacterium]